MDEEQRIRTGACLRRDVIGCNSEEREFVEAGGGEAAHVEALRRQRLVLPVAGGGDWGERGI